MPKKLKSGQNKPIQLTKEEVDKLRLQVVCRDNSVCIFCGHPYKTVHEIEPRSSSIKNSSKVFRLDNMVCVCNGCHYRLHNDADFIQRGKEIALEYISQATLRL